MDKIQEIKDHLSKEDKKLVDFLFSLSTVQTIVKRICEKTDITQDLAYDIFCGLITLNFSFTKTDRISGQVKMRGGVDVFISFDNITYNMFMLKNFKKDIDNKKIILANDIKDLNVKNANIYTLKVSANDVLWNKVPEIFQDVVIDNLT